MQLKPLKYLEVMLHRAILNDDFVALKVDVV